jgi:hypothetical protein
MASGGFCGIEDIIVSAANLRRYDEFFRTLARRERR